MSALNRRENRDVYLDRIKAQYLSKTDINPMDRLSDTDMDSLLVNETADYGIDSIVCQETSKAFQEAHDISNMVSWSPRDVWIKLNNLDEMKTFKPLLKSLGYNYTSTFKGSIFDDEEMYWVVVGKKQKPVFDDSKGKSKKLKNILSNLSMHPEYVYVVGDSAHADFSLTLTNIAAVKHYIDETNKKQPGFSPAITPDTTKSIDMFCLWPMGLPKDLLELYHSSNDRYNLLSIEDLLDTQGGWAQYIEHV